VKASNTSARGASTTRRVLKLVLTGLGDDFEVF